MRDPEGSQSHPLRIHHADELRHCLLQTPGTQRLSCAAPWRCGRLGAHGCSGFCHHPTSTQGRPCSAGRSLGAVGTGIMGAACSLPLVPHGDRRHLPHRGPCGAWGTVGTRPAPPCILPPIRDPRAAPTPSANQSPGPIVFTANPRGRRGTGQHGRLPTSQSAPGCARGGGRAGQVPMAGVAPRSRRGRL